MPEDDSLSPARMLSADGEQFGQSSGRGCGWRLYTGWQQEASWKAIVVVQERGCCPGLAEE